MIHSLSGGVVRETQFFDYAKVKVDDGSVFWFISEISDLKSGDVVLVPIGKNDILKTAIVLRVDKHINGQTAPVPLKRMKKIFGKK